MWRKTFISQNSSLGLDVPLCKECTNLPRSRELSLGCHFGSRRSKRTSAVNSNNVFVWTTVFLTCTCFANETEASRCESRCARQKLNTHVKPSDSSVKKNMRRMKFQFLKCFRYSLHCTSHLPWTAGRDHPQKAGEESTQRRISTKTNTASAVTRRGWQETDKSIWAEDLDSSSARQWKSRARSSEQEDLCHDFAGIVTSTRSTVCAYETHCCSNFSK